MNVLRRIDEFNFSIVLVDTVVYIYILVCCIYFEVA